MNSNIYWIDGLELDDSQYSSYILKKYMIKFYGDKAVDIPYSNSEGVSNIIQNIPNGTFTVYATDSRGNSTPITKLANKVIDYSPLTKNSIDVYRSNGVSEEVILKLEGTIDEVNFGVKTNSIILAYYQYSVAGSGEWSEAIQFTPEVKDGKFTYNAVIEGDLASKGFNISNSYEINVMVFDELGGVTFTDTFGSGIPNIALHKNGVGIMGKYDDSVGGDFQIRGKNPFDYTKTVDANGWTKIDFGTYQEYYKNFSFTYVYSGNVWGLVNFSGTRGSLPVGITFDGNNMSFAGTARCSDTAILHNVCVTPNSINVTYNNTYGGEVSGPTTIVNLVLRVYK